MSVVLNAILPVFALIGLGVIVKLVQNIQHPFAAKICDLTGHCDDTWSEVLNKFALYIALPALIIHGLANTDRSSLIGMDIILTNVVLLVLLVLFLVLITKLFRFKTPVAQAYIIGGFFGNVAYIGPPFVLSLFPGTEGEISILIAIHVIVALTIGLYILERGQHSKPHLHDIAKGIFFNPLIIAVIVGLLLLFTGNPLPSYIDRALAMLAASASPTVLIAIGLFITRKVRFDRSFLHGMTIALLKIIFMPAVFLFGAVVMLYQTGFQVSILEAGMPVALTTFALAEIYPMDKKIVAKAIILSTLLSLLTLTLLAGFVL